MSTKLKELENYQHSELVNVVLSVCVPLFGDKLRDFMISELSNLANTNSALKFRHLSPVSSFW